MANPFCCPRLSVVSNSSHCLTLARSKSFHAPFNSNLIVFIPLNTVEESQRVFYYVFETNSFDSFSLDRKDSQNVSKRDKKKRELIYMLDDTIVYSQKYFKRKLWDEKRKNKRRGRIFQNKRGIHWSNSYFCERGNR